MDRRDDHAARRKLVLRQRLAIHRLEYHDIRKIAVELAKFGQPFRRSLKADDVYAHGLLTKSNKLFVLRCASANG
jgi:hypothetical protein